MFQGIEQWYSMSINMVYYLFRLLFELFSVVKHSIYLSTNIITSTDRTTIGIVWKSQS